MNRCDDVGWLVLLTAKSWLARLSRVKLRSTRSETWLACGSTGAWTTASLEFVHVITCLIIYYRGMYRSMCQPTWLFKILVGCEVE